MESTAIGIEAARSLSAYELHACDLHMERASYDRDGWRWYVCGVCDSGWTMGEWTTIDQHPPTACGAACDAAVWLPPTCLGCQTLLPMYSDGGGGLGLPYQPCPVCVTAVTGIHPLDADALARLEQPLCRICGLTVDAPSSAGEEQPALVDCQPCLAALADVRDALGALVPQTEELAELADDGYPPRGSWLDARGLLVSAALYGDAAARTGEQPFERAWRRSRSIRELRDAARDAVDAAESIREYGAGAGRTSCLVCGALLPASVYERRECEGCAWLVDACQRLDARLGRALARSALAEAAREKDAAAPPVEPSWARAPQRRADARRWLAAQPAQPMPQARD